MNVIEVGDNAFLSSVQAAVVTTENSSRNMLTEATDAQDIGGYSIAPWGDDNVTPQEVMEKIDASEVVSSNLLFNICTGYGQGLKPMRKVIENGQARYDELDPKEAKYKKVLDFCETNDIEGFWLEQMSDLQTFFNVFPEILFDPTGKKAVGIRSVEATQSRWGSIIGKERRIMRHYHSVKWDDSPDKDDITETLVLDRFNPLFSLQETINKTKDRNFIYHVNFPTPGRTYYQKPYWWSIFNSGWYDFLIQIPQIKNSLLQNQLGVRYIVYVHPDYWNAIYKSKDIDASDEKAKATAKKVELKNINDFIAGAESQGKGIVATKNYRPVANGLVEEKWIEFVELPRAVKEGELIADSEEASNVVSYAMLVHSSLLGSTPGKNNGSFSGSDKRELFNIKVAMMAPYISRLLRPFYFIKQVNKWPEDVVFINPKIEIVTTDKDSTASTTKTEE